MAARRARWGLRLPNPFHNCGLSSPYRSAPPLSSALPREHRPIPLTHSRAFTLSYTRTETKSAAPRGSQNAVPAGEGGEATDRALTPALPGARTPSRPALAAAGSPVFSQTCWSNLGTIGLLGRSWRSPGAALHWEPLPGALCADPGLEPKSADGSWTARQSVSRLPKPGRQSRGTHAMLAAWRARCPHPTRRREAESRLPGARNTDRCLCRLLLPPHWKGGLDPNRRNPQRSTG